MENSLSSTAFTKDNLNTSEIKNENSNHDYDNTNSNESIYSDYLTEFIRSDSGEYSIITSNYKAHSTSPSPSKVSVHSPANDIPLFSMVNSSYHSGNIANSTVRMYN